MRVRPFAAESFIYADRADGSNYSETQPYADGWAESRMLVESIEPHRFVRTAPGIANIAKQHPCEAGRQRMAVLQGSKEHIRSPESVFIISTQGFRAAYKVEL